MKELKVRAAVLLAVLCVCQMVSGHGQERVCFGDDGILAVFWNLENFFDWKDSGGGESDSEFSPDGSRHWTSGRFWAKAGLIAKTLLLIGDADGRMPDFIGLAEVENRRVLSLLNSQTALEKSGYEIIHYESGDRRGIDVGALYRKDVMTLLSSRAVRIDTLRTRDILECVFLDRSGDTLIFLVNHHPSKLGGKSAEGRREAAMKTMVDLCRGRHRCVCMGDFNDTRDSPAFRLCEGVLRVVDYEKNDSRWNSTPGTIRYKGVWESIDLFLVSEDLMEDCRAGIAGISYLLEKDRGYGGLKPRRCYTGPRYNGGVSDHLPIVIRLGRVRKERDGTW